MGVPAVVSSDRRPVLGDWIAGIALFSATAGFILWQSTRATSLVDVSYVLDNAVRIADGQMPYRDFVLPQAPLTFVVQAMIMRLLGRVLFHHVLYAALIGGLGTVLAWRLIFQSLRERVPSPWTIALLLTAPLTILGTYGICAFPNYDADCGFWLLTAIWFMQRIDLRAGVVGGFLAGVFACVPAFFKQDRGLPFLVAAIGSVMLVLAAKRLQRGESSAERPRIETLLAALCGACAALLVAALTMHWTVGIGNYFQWTIRYAAERRVPPLREMLDIYIGHHLARTLMCVVIGLILLRDGFGQKRWTRVAAFILFGVPLLGPLISLLMHEDADQRAASLVSFWPPLLVLAAVLALWNTFQNRAQSLRDLLPLVLIIAINGAFMSHQLDSTYALWPFLVLLIAEMLAFLHSFAKHGGTANWLVAALTVLISGMLIVGGADYAVSEEILEFVHLPDGPPQHSEYRQLAGLATPGSYLSEFDEFLRYATANIPINDGLIFYPGEDPFYFATGRVPRFPVQLFDSTSNPYSPNQLSAQVLSHNIRWVILKRDLQINGGPFPDQVEVIRALTVGFAPVAHLRGYDVYRR